jgi:two-component system, NtrC family, response regulator
MNFRARVCESGLEEINFMGMAARSPDSVRILYVEDDATSGRLVKAIAEKEGYSIDLVATEKECLKSASDDPPDLFLIDLTLPDASGLDLLQKLREKHAAVPAIIVTASDSIHDVIGAMKRGAVDYLTKPIDTRRMVVSLANAVKMTRQQNAIARLVEQVGQVYAPENLIGSSPAMEQVRRLIRRAAQSEATVLIVGESGTGKELVARALHAAGPRVAGPFVDVNSAALTETLLESELFGHEKGAFTSAIARRRGKFEQAHGGTIFLDEIGDMPGPTQAKMLRVLQERAFQRVGGDEKIAVDVRVICATNRNLEELVEQGAFRKDLFYRINTLVVDVPALRSRTTDIPELARHFLARTNQAEKRSVQDISAAAMEALCSHSWPGHVRELQHAIERAVLVCDGAEILPEHLPPAVLRTRPLPEAPAGKEGLVEAVERLERSMILTALERNGWVKARTARALGVTERILAYKMNNLGIEKAGT